MKRYKKKHKNLSAKIKRLHRQREKRRLSRKGRKYCSDRPSDAFIVRKNPNVKIKGRFKGTVTLELPAQFDTEESRDETLGFLRQLRDEAINGNSKKLVLNHQKTELMTLDAALLLLAEVQRCSEYVSPKKKITGTYPKSERVSQLLSGMGFYRALGVSDPPTRQDRIRIYSEVVFHNKIIPERAKYLLDCFETYIEFGSRNRKALYVALLECMDNCYQHAYREDSSRPYLFQQWWLAGFSDLERGQIAFAFLDQGESIPRTIRSRPFQLSLGTDLIHSDTALIREATIRRLSRFGGKRRGYGMPFLRRFIELLDQHKFQGALRIISNRGDYRRFGDERENWKSLAEPFEGTLLTWSVKSMHASGTDSEVLDLS